MLIELQIKDFAIIEEIQIPIKQGLTVFTGETGAGKSIIVDAIETLLGARVDTTLIRTGAEKSIVQGIFVIPDFAADTLTELLSKEELLDDCSTITLERVIRRNGRNTARINGYSVNSSLIHKIGSYLVDIHGQSNHLSLLNSKEHVELLDRFGDSVSDLQTSRTKREYKRVYVELTRVKKQIKELLQETEAAIQQIDLLQYQIKEIESANLGVEEDTKLLDERNRLANAENLVNLSQEVIQALDEGSPESTSATDLLGQAVEALYKIKDIDSSQQNNFLQAEKVFTQLTDLSGIFRDYLTQIEFNPIRLDQVEERLDLINNLKKKYGASIPEIFSFLENSKEKLDTITYSEEKLAELYAEKQELLDSISNIGQELTELRKNAAINLEKSIALQMESLKMGGARLHVSINHQPDPDGVVDKSEKNIKYFFNGLDEIEFLIETNPGEGFKPLTKIASGGETARLMLALKYVLAEADFIPTLIFDEIDQGIGGRIGTVVGKKLKELSNNHQVLCVTHLPQIAAFGDQHFLVTKSPSGDRTITTLDSITGDERIDEIALMLGAVNESNKKSATDLLKSTSQVEV